MHIVHLTPGFAVDEHDDQCLPALQDLVRGLAATGEYEQSVVALHYPAQRPETRWHDVSVHSIGSPKALWTRPVGWNRALSALASLHRSKSIDVLLSYFLTDTALVAQRFASKNGTPLALVAMGQDALPTNRYLRWALRRHALARWIAPSARTADLLRNALPLLEIEVVPWGVPEPDLPSLVDERPIDLLGVGNLTEGKDFRTLVELTAHRQKRAPTRAVLIGDGPERQRIEETVRSLGVEEQVEVRGAEPRQRVLEAMTQSRVLVHPSRYESFGLVFAEAAAAGMSILSRPVGAAPTTSEPGWRLFSSSQDACEQLEALESDAGTSRHFPLRATVEAYRRTITELAAPR